VFLSLAIGAVVAIWHGQHVSRGVLQLVCMAPVVSTNSTFLASGSSTSGHYLQMTTWDLRETHGDLADVLVSGKADRLRLRMQLPWNRSSLLPFSLETENDDQFVWRLLSNSSAIQATTNTLCVDGVALLILTANRRDDALSMFGVPEARLDADTDLLIVP
jgi:hypothetical protein